MEILFFGGLGLIIGSFLNVLILRQPASELAQAGEGERSLLGRSACSSCKKELGVLDLVPVFSWVCLRGKCRYCRSRISLQYPLVEIATGLLFVVVGFSALPIVLKILGVSILSLFTAITVYDIYHTVIPDLWSYGASVLALLYGLLGAQDMSAVGYVFLGGVVTVAPLFALWFVSNGRWMGFGDVKLALAIGFLLGPMGLFAVMFAFIIGALVSVFILLPLSPVITYAQKFGITLLSIPMGGYTMKSEVPFGPFLIVGCLSLWFLEIYGFNVLALIGF